jgi:hypothetical protein
MQLGQMSGWSVPWFYIDLLDTNAYHTSAPIYKNNYPLEVINTQTYHQNFTLMGTIFELDDLSSLIID